MNNIFVSSFYFHELITRKEEVFIESILIVTAVYFIIFIVILVLLYERYYGGVIKIYSEKERDVMELKFGDDVKFDKKIIIMIVKNTSHRFPEV